jgi:hypothetical protein
MRLISLNPDPFGSEPIQLNNRVDAAVILSSISYRIVIVFSIFILLRRLFDSAVLAHALVINFLFLLASPYAKMFGFLASLITEDIRSISWLERSPSVFLIYYDYIALATVIFLLVFLEKLRGFSIFGTIFLGVVLFFVYEFLPIFLFFLFFLTSIHQKKWSQFLALLAPGFLLIAVLDMGSAPNQSLASTFLFYLRSNFEHILAIPILLILVLTPPLLTGYLLGRTLSKLGFFPRNLDLERSNKLVRSAILSMSLVHSISLFTSGITGEFARQSLALQLLILIWGTLVGACKSFKSSN